MAERTLIKLFPIFAFAAGASLKTLNIILDASISASTAAIFSIVSLGILMLAFSLIYSK